MNINIYEYKYIFIYILCMIVDASIVRLTIVKEEGRV